MRVLLLNPTVIPEAWTLLSGRHDQLQRFHPKGSQDARSETDLAALIMGKGWLRTGGEVMSGARGGGREAGEADRLLGRPEAPWWCACPENQIHQRFCLPSGEAEALPESITTQVSLGEGPESAVRQSQDPGKERHGEAHPQKAVTREAQRDVGGAW